MIAVIATIALLISPWVASAAGTIYLQTDGSFSKEIEGGVSLTESSQFTGLITLLAGTTQDFGYTFQAWTTNVATATLSVGLRLNPNGSVFCSITQEVNQFTNIYYVERTACGALPSPITSASLVFSVSEANRKVRVAGSSGNQPFGVVSLGSDPAQTIPDFQLNAGAFGIATSTAEAFCEQNFPFDDSDIVQATISFLPNGICRVGAFLFVPSGASTAQFGLLASTTQAKIPFSYVYGLVGVFSGLTASSTSNLSSVVIAFPAIGSSTALGAIVPTTIVGLSTSTISTYLPESVRQGFLGLQRVFLWAGFIYFIYRRIVPHHVIESKTT